MHPAHLNKYKYNHSPITLVVTVPQTVQPLPLNNNLQHRQIKGTQRHCWCLRSFPIIPLRANRGWAFALSLCQAHLFAFGHSPYITEQIPSRISYSEAVQKIRTTTGAESGESPSVMIFARPSTHTLTHTNSCTKVPGRCDQAHSFKTKITTALDYDNRMHSTIF